MEKLTYDVMFSDADNTNNKGFKASLDFCKDFINTYNGTDYSYFKDYKGGLVSIVDLTTNENVYTQRVY